MKDIIRIVIKGESGYCSVDDAYNDKITITRDSIRYEYKPMKQTRAFLGTGHIKRIVQPFRSNYSVVQIAFIKDQNRNILYVCIG